MTEHKTLRKRTIDTYRPLFLLLISISVFVIYRYVTSVYPQILPFWDLLTRAFTDYPLASYIVIFTWGFIILWIWLERIGQNGSSISLRSSKPRSIDTNISEFIDTATDIASSKIVKNNAGISSSFQTGNYPLPKFLETQPLATVTIFKGKGKQPQFYPLLDSTITIGRNKANDIVLEEPTISLRHALILREGYNFIIQDSESSNGLYVNNQQIQKHTLEHDDQIVIGPLVLYFHHTDLYQTLTRLDDLWIRYTEQAENNQAEYTKTTQLISEYVARALELPIPNTLEMSLQEQAYLLEGKEVFDGIKFEPNIVLVYLQNSSLSKNLVLKLQESLSTKLSTPVSIVLLVMPEQTVSNVAKSIIKSIYDLSLFEWVLLSYEEVYKIVVATAPDRIFRQIILDYVQIRSSLSPYIAGGPTSGKMFFGRVRELQIITELIHNHAIAVVGGRRTGKTSLLLRLHNNELLRAGFRSVYCECSNATSTEEFLNQQESNSQPAFEGDKRFTLKELLIDPPTDKSLVLLLDEADKLVALDAKNEWRFFNFLRSIVNSGKIEVILSGERKLFDAMHDTQSPLFNFATRVPMRMLEREAVYELVTGPMQKLEIRLQGDEDIVNSILQYSAGHPYFVQSMCKWLIDQLEKRGHREISQQDVIQMVKNPEFVRQEFLSNYFQNNHRQGLTKIEQLILLFMAFADQAQSLTEIQKGINDNYQLSLDLAEIDQALGTLTSLFGVLESTTEGYIIVSSFPNLLSIHTDLYKSMVQNLMRQYNSYREYGGDDAF